MEERRPRLFDSLIFLLLLSGPPRLRARDPTAALRMEIDWAVIVQLSVWALACAWLLVQLYPMVVARGLLPRLWAPQLIAGAFLVSLVPAMWFAPGFVPTAYALAQIAITVAFAWTFVQRFGPDSFLRHLFWGYLILAVALAVAWLAMPELVIRRERLRGDLIAPTGAVAAMGLALLLAGRVRVARTIMLATAGLFLVILAASQTRTAFAALALFFVIGWVFRGPSPVKRATPLAIVLALVAGIAGVLPAVQLHIIRETRSIVTLSERIPLWSFLVEETLRESPIFGLGYQSAIRLLAPQFHQRIGNAHSVFVEVFVGAGVLGFVLFCLLCAALVGYALRLTLYWRESDLALSVVALFAVAVTLSLTTSTGIQAGPIGFTFWSMTALLPASLEALRAGTVAPVVDPPRPLLQPGLAT